jgi:hypothetical protein
MGVVTGPTTAPNDYHIVTTWQVEAPRAEVVSAIFDDTAALARWWPAVYLDVRVEAPGDDAGVGQEVSLYTKGWLPYTLRWRFRVTEVDLPDRLVLEAVGDFVGRGIWTLREVRGADDPRGPSTSVEYDWWIRAEKGVLKRFSTLMKPLFAANHNWAMRQGERSLRLELARRRTTDPLVLAAIAAPPRPTFPHNLALFRRGRA